MVWRGFFYSFPFPSLLFGFIFKEREIFLCYRLIVTKRGECVWEKFSPFSCTLHMWNNFSADFFIFVIWVRGVEDAVIFFSEANTPKTMMRIVTEFGVPHKWIIVSQRTEWRKFNPVACMTFILLFAFKSWLVHVITVFDTYIFITIPDILTF